MKKVILLMMGINFIFSNELKLKVKNCENDYEFKNLKLNVFSLKGNVEIEKYEFLIENLKPLEEKMIIINYNFKKPEDDKLIIEIRDGKNEQVFGDIKDLKYKEILCFKFNFYKNILVLYFPKDGILKLNIFDKTGRKVFSKEEFFKRGEYKKDFSFLTPGEYFYEIKFDKRYKGKFIILKKEGR